MLRDHIDALGIQIDRLTSRIQELIGAIPAAQPPGDGAGPSGPGTAAAITGTQDTDQPLPPQPDPLSALHRLDEVPGIGVKAAQVIIAELGLDMDQFPTPGQLVSWARLAPRTIQSGANAAPAPPARATPTSRACSARSPPRPPRPTPSPGRALPPPGPAHRQAQGLVAIARSILVTVWHLLADPTARFHDLGADYHTRRIDKNRKTRNLVRQLQALGHKVTLEPAA